MSATTVARINTLVTANTTQFRAAMAKAQTRAGKFAAAAGAAAKAASGPLTMGLLAVGGAAVKAATDFDDSMTKIESLVGIAGAEVDAMKESVRDLSGQTAQAPAKLADAMFFIQSAGLRGATAMETLEASAKAAAVGLGDVTEIADLATSALNAYGEENLSAVDATDVLTAAVREGKLEASELAGSMGRVLPIASAMGVRFDEVGAAFAALSRTGTNAAEAATQVRGILSSLLRPTKQAEEALTGMGLSSEGLRRQIKEEGLLATLQTLAEEFDGNAAASASVFGNIRALSGVMDLMGENVATTEAIFANMTDTTGTLDDAFAVVSDTAGFKFRQALADIQEALVGIGERAIPIVMTMMEGVRSMVGAFQALPTPVKLAAAAVAAFVVASGPIGQIALAVGGLLYVFGQLGEESRRAAERQKDLTAEFVAAGDPANTMISQMQEMANAIEDVGDSADDATDPVADFVGSNVALGMALDNETLPMFEELGISMDDVAAAAENGTDAFQGLQRMGNRTSIAVRDLDSEFGDLSGSGKEVAQALMDAFNAGDITRPEFVAMLDVVDELADAFDDNREEVEKQAEEFVKSADAVKLLNNANLDAEKILADLTASGKSFTEQAEEIHRMVVSVAEAQADSSIEAKRAAAQLGLLGDEMSDTEGVVQDVAEAFEDAADETKSFEDAFKDLVATILGPGDALNDAQLLIQDVNEVIADLAEGTLPDAREEFSTFAQEAAASLGRLVDEGMELGGPELMFHAQAFIDKLAEINEVAKKPVEELFAMIQVFEDISGVEIPVEVTFELVAGTLGEDNLLDQIGQMYGSTSVTPRAPAPSRIPFNPADYPFFEGATGGIVRRPTMALIGEAGPEAVVPLSSAPGASALPTGGVGGGTVNLTVNMPPGANGNDVVRALQQYARAHGGKVPIVTGQL